MSVHSDCLWLVNHFAHFAWYQRAFLIGDFKPGLVPRSEYVVDDTGRNADPDSPPKCFTCGEIPKAENLEVFESATGQSGFLTPFRSGAVAWPAPTNPSTCWYCNARNSAVVEQGLCRQCLNHLESTSTKSVQMTPGKV